MLRSMRGGTALGLEVRPILDEEARDARVALGHRLDPTVITHTNTHTRTRTCNHHDKKQRFVEKGGKGGWEKNNRAQICIVS